MKDFEILRYFKKWWFLIAGLSALAGLFFMRYATNKQTYTAQSTIRYAYEEAEEGLAPDGSELDVSEIFSSTVVKDTLEELELSASVDSIRSNGSVISIIPEDVEKLQEAKIEAGDEYDEYYPIDYKVRFTADNKKGAEYARQILDSVLSNYFVEFGEKYVNQSSIPNNALNAISSDYDYIEQAEIINNSVEEIINQMGEKQSMSPDFHSARTGLTLSDLYDQYNYISTIKIPYLFSEILSTKLTQDKDVLIKKYKERIASYDLSSNTDADKVAAVLEVIESYGDKNKEGSLYYSQDSTGDSGNLNGNILGEVYEDYLDDESGEVVDRTTVYDQLIADYVTLENSKSYAIIDAAYCEYIIETFQEKADSQMDQEEAKQVVEEHISSLVDELNTLYVNLSTTMEEYNEYLGAQNVVVLSSTSVSASVNVKLYMMLGIVLFFIIGCLGAILLGRLQDFAEYFFYTDTRLKLPNRSACDRLIRSYSGKVLPASFSCIVMELTNLNQVNNLTGREQGDMLLNDFVKLVKAATESYGFVAYNGGNQIIGFFDKCTAENLENCHDFMVRLVKNYNEEHENLKMRYTVGRAESKTDDAYTIRSLIKKAMESRKEQDVE
jgi:GGDEF domain-containing protein